VVNDDPAVAEPPVWAAKEGLPVRRPGDGARRPRVPHPVAVVGDGAAEAEEPGEAAAAVAALRHSAAEDCAGGGNEETRRENSRRRRRAHHIVHLEEQERQGGGSLTGAGATAFIHRLHSGPCYCEFRVEWFRSLSRFSWSTV
jgi:hypothetical protein